MSIFVRVDCSFYNHRKTIRLRALIGDDGFWVPPRLWAYAAEHQPDGIFSDYSDAEISIAIGYSKDAQALLQALLQAGFLDSDRKIHDWEEHNGYHASHKAKARLAAEARWGKKRGEVEEKRVEESARARGSAPSNASSIPEASEAKTDHYHPDARAALHILNEASGAHFREVDSNLTVISARLREPDVDISGVRKMIERQCKRWKGTTQAEYLRPETLFGKSKFDSYYAARELVISDANGQAGKPRFDRNAGTANEGRAHLYKGVAQSIGLPAKEPVQTPNNGTPTSV